MLTPSCDSISRRHRSHQIRPLRPLRLLQRPHPLNTLPLLLPSLIPQTHPHQNRHAPRNTRPKERRHDNTLRSDLVMLLHADCRAGVGVDRAEEAGGAGAGRHAVGDA